MNSFTRFVLFGLLLSLLALPCLAKEEPWVRDVFLVSSLNYADALVMAPVSAKYSTPILLTDSKELSFDTKHSLELFKPRRVYLVGGRKVLAESLEQQLGFFNTTRIWGATRYGTASEVARAFWPESGKAVLVRDNVGTSRKFYLDVALASRKAVQEKIPLLFVYYGKVPDTTAIALRELGVKEVYLYGDYSSAVVQQLGLMGLIVREGLFLDPVQETGSGERQVMALGSWEDSLYVPFLESDAVIVSSQAESFAFQDKLRGSNVKVELLGDNSISREIELGLEVQGIDFEKGLKPVEFSNQFLGNNWEELQGSFFSYVSFVEKTALRERHSLLEARAMLPSYALRFGLDSAQALQKADSGISFIELLVGSRNFQEAWLESFKYKDVVFLEMSKRFKEFMDFDTS